jgi:hypothetical protein
MRTALAAALASFLPSTQNKTLVPTQVEPSQKREKPFVFFVADG